MEGRVLCALPPEVMSFLVSNAVQQGHHDTSPPSTFLYFSSVKGGPNSTNLTGQLQGLR